MPALYRPILKQALGITWRYRLLWLFGFFAALVGSGGGYNLLVAQVRKLSEQSTLINNIVVLFKTGIVKDFFVLFSTKPLTLFLITAIAIILIIVFISVVVLSQIILIKSPEQTKRGGSIHFKPSLEVAKKYFWRIVGLNIVFQLVIAFLAFMAGINLLFLLLVENQFFLLIAGILILTSLILLILFAAFIMEFASRYIVLNNESIILSVRKGVVLFKNNWLVSLEIGFILFVITLIINGLLASFSFYTFGLPFIITLILTKGALFQGLLSIALFIIILVSALMGALLSVFCYTSWTLLFMRLTDAKEKCLSKTIRAASCLHDRFTKNRKKAPDLV